MMMIFAKVKIEFGCGSEFVCTEQKIPDAKFSEVPRKKENYCYDFRSFNLNI